MPVEVKELVMRMNMPSKNGKLGSGSACGGGSSDVSSRNESQQSDSQKEIIAACVEQVLSILERGKER